MQQMYCVYLQEKEKKKKKTRKTKVKGWIGCSTASSG
jgi:hypothetical protein